VSQHVVLDITYFIFCMENTHLQVSWIVSPTVKHLETSETVHQEEDGSFKTLSSMSLYVPESAEEDVVVECVAKHHTLDVESNIAAIHIIKIEAPTTSTATTSTSSMTTTRTTTTTEEMRTSRDNLNAPSINYDNLIQEMSNYDYDETDDYYYEDTEIEAVSVEEADKNVPHDKIPDESDTVREIAENDAVKSDYNKYNIEPEPQDNVTHILMNNLDEKNFTILDAEMTHDVNGVTSLNETDSTLIKDIKTKDETYPIAIHDSTKSFDAVAENTNKKSQNENKTKPVKASIIMSSAVNGKISIFCAIICVIGVHIIMK